MKESIKQKRNFKQKGITLIALVITIIVLLILAGVTIAALSGPNGILTNATKAKENTEIGEETEIVNLAASNVRSNKIINRDSTSITEEELRQSISELTNKTVTIGTEADDEGNEFLTVTFESGRKYKVNPGVGEVKDLVEVAEVGDYINYPVSYTNVGLKQSGTTIGTGWRVFSKVDNKIKIISEGAPIGDYYDYVYGGTNLNTEIVEFYTNEFDEYTENRFITNYAEKASGLTVDLLNEYLQSIGEENIEGNLEDYWYNYYEIKDEKNMFFEDFNFVFNITKDPYGSPRLMCLEANRLSPFGEYTEIVPIRVIVTLKDGLKTTAGTGDKASPYELQ